MAEMEYKRLTRARVRSSFAVISAARSSLWLGADHLLCVDTTGYTETYKRFYFRDIQAITICKTARRKVWNWSLGVPGFICLAFLLANLLASRGGIAPETMIPWTIVLLVFAVPLLINNLLGPTTICHLRTAVQSEELAPLSRLRRARKVLARLRPLIESAQGRLAPEELQAPVQEANPAALNPQPALAEAARYVVDDPNAPPRILS